MLIYREIDRILTTIYEYKNLQFILNKLLYLYFNIMFLLWRLLSKILAGKIRKN